MSLRNAIVAWSQSIGLRIFDIEFADWLCHQHDDEAEWFWFVTWCLSYQASQGHVCVDLAQPLAFAAMPESLFAKLPTSSQLRASLAGCPLVGAPESATPLVLLESGKLYLRRFYRLERALARQIASRAHVDLDLTDAAVVARITTLLDRLFDDSPATHGQKLACANAIINQFAIIAGGPGTGKTTTVVRLLAALSELEALPPESICLVAPTGKAAMRLSQSIRENRERLIAVSGLGATIPDTASTVHRLLRYSRARKAFHFNRSNPLPVRVVIVDEASMIDVSMMLNLLDAIPAGARVILLGDQYQLSSVDEGSVLAELCGDLSQHTYSAAHDRRLSLLVAQPTGSPVSEDVAPLSDAISVLRFSFRFGGGTELGALARAINAADVDAVFAAFRASTENSPRDPALSLRWLEDSSAMLNAIAEIALVHAAALLSVHDVAESFRILGQFRLLSATRDGAFGVEALNQLIVSRLNQQMSWQRRRVYPGLPVIVLENDYDVGLFNGDTGVVVEHEGILMVAFESETVDALHRFIPMTCLPRWEPAYAMTIHKSQGSEFDRVALVLPPVPLPLLTRELLYTGVTRSRAHVALFATEPVIRHALRVSGLRQSGLAELLARCRSEVTA